MVSEDSTDLLSVLNQLTTPTKRQMDPGYKTAKETVQSRMYLPTHSWIFARKHPELFLTPPSAVSKRFAQPSDFPSELNTRPI
jgi:hypothetical protein